MLKKRIGACLIFVGILSSLFAGCTSSDQSSGTSSTDSSAASSSSENGFITESGYPIVNEPLTLSYFHYLDGKASATMSSYADMACYQELEKITGVTIEWLHPPVGQESEQFNLMIASNDLPDMIYWNNWKNVTGGIYGMIDGKTILPLNDLMEEYAPNYLETISKNDEINRQARLDDGTLYAFMLINSEGHRINNAGGLQVREDWLEKLGLSLPNNIQELEDVLIVIRDGDPNGNGQADELPFVGIIDDVKKLLRTFGVDYGMSVQDDKVVYGPITPEYKEYLETMKSWYEQGLLDPEYVVTDGTSKKAKITGDLGGVYWGLLGADMGTYMTAKADDPEFDLNGIPPLQSDDGKRYAYRTPYCPGDGTAITTACEYPEVATRWLDYAYSEEGHMLMIFGIEGESYEMVDGKPTFTDVIMKNPDGLAFAQALTQYSIGSMSGPVEKDQVHFEQSISTIPQQLECFNRWQENDPTEEIFLPPVNMTSEETSTYAAIMTEVQSYVDEMHDRFIMGREPLENFDQYVESIKALGIDQAIEAQQAAYDRYISI